MTPEPSSLWPLRVVGDPRWLSNHVHTWDGGVREPVAVARSVWYDWHVAGYLYGMVRKNRPITCIETGVHVGKSSTAILAGLHRNRKGNLWSYDLPKYQMWCDGDGYNDTSMVKGQNGTGELIPNRLKDRWQLRIGDSTQLLQNKSWRIDFFLHDSAHDHFTQSFEYEWAWSHLRPGGVLISDDTDRSTAWKEFLECHRGKWDRLEDGPGAMRGVRKG